MGPPGYNGWDMARPFEHIKPTLRTWGQNRARVLILPGAGQGPGCWEPVGRALAGRGLSAACLEYPGHGEKPWPAPPFTNLRDYTLLAARAAAGLGRPILAGHDLGGLLVQRLLGLADLPALLLAPWPKAGLLYAAPSLGWNLLRGRPQEPGFGSEPWQLRMQAALGWPMLQKGRAGGAPCLVAAPQKDPLIKPAGLAALARTLHAGLVSLPESGHHLWKEPQVVLGLIAKLASMM